MSNRWPKVQKMPSFDHSKYSPLCIFHCSFTIYGYDFSHIWIFPEHIRLIGNVIKETDVRWRVFITKKETFMKEVCEGSLSWRSLGTSLQRYRGIFKTSEEKPLLFSLHDVRWKIISRNNLWKSVRMIMAATCEPTLSCWHNIKHRTPRLDSVWHSNW